jgi:hypothetical protein
MRPLPNILIKYAALDSIIVIPILHEFLLKDSSKKFLLKSLRQSE